MSGTEKQTGAETRADAEVPEQRSPEQIQADIEQTRQQLGETVDALSAKMDVKGRARDRAVATRQQTVARVEAARRRATDAATNADGNVRPAVPAGAAVVVVAAATIAVIAWRRRR